MNMLPTVRRQLFEAVERRAQPIPRARRRLTPGRVLTAALVAVPVLIVALAFVVLGGHRAAPPASSAAHPQTARQQLIDHFGVLRRRQTAADRDNQLLLPPFFKRTARELRHPAPTYEKLLRQWGDPRLDAPLMRVVNVPRFDGKIALEPASWQPSPSSPRRSEGLILAMRIGSAGTIPLASEMGSGPRPTAVATLLARGLALADIRPHSTVIDGVLVVPDNVAKVTLGPIRLLRMPVSVDPSAFGNATAAVHDNVAAYQLRLPTVHSPRASGPSLFGTGGVAEVTWFDAAGRMIKRTTTNLDLFVRVLGTGK